MKKYHFGENCYLGLSKLFLSPPQKMQALFLDFAQSLFNLISLTIYTLLTLYFTHL